MLNKNNSITSIPKAGKNKRALLVEGGGMKGAFSGGVMTALNFSLPAQEFDLIVAVSSGACSAAYYATTPKPEVERGEKLLNIWRWELAGSRLISIFKPLKKRTLLDQKFLVDDLFRVKYRLEAENFEKKGLPKFLVAVCNLKEKKLEYIRATKDNIFDLLKAATSLPIATKGKHIVDGVLYCDAAILNPLPLQDLIDAGYKDITVIMNSPVWWESLPLPRFTRFLSFPFNRQISKLMKQLHHHHFNQARSIAQNPPKDIILQVIAPDDILPVGLVTTKRESLEETVELGKSKGKEAVKELMKRFSAKGKKLPHKKMGKKSKK
jgi:predicted patatin/cPLA2 family phospholipase